MSYEIDYAGKFKLEQPLTVVQAATLKAFSKDRHSEDIQGNRSYPGIHCDWIPTTKGDGIKARDTEGFMNAAEWLLVIIEQFLKPWGHVLSGTVTWRGHEHNDTGSIVVKNNTIMVVPHPDHQWMITNFRVFESKYVVDTTWKANLPDDEDEDED